MLPPVNFRLRMMLLFCFVIGVLMAITCAAVYSIFVKTIRAELDHDLVNAARPIIGDLSGDHQEGNFPELNSQEQMVVFTQAGHALTRSKNADPLLIAAFGDFPHPRSAYFRSLRGSEGPLRAAVIPFESNQRPLWFIIARPTTEIEYSQWRFRDTLFGIWVLSLLLTAVIADWYVGSSLRPIIELTRRAESLTENIADRFAAHPAAALPVVNPNDEVGQLAKTFNLLFNRVDSVVRQMRQFVSDASHELRTPLSVLRGETQYLIEQERTAEEYQATLRIISDELLVLTRIVEGLFTLSMADAGQLRLTTEALTLDEVLEEACGIAAPLARRSGIKIEKLAWEEVPFVGDQALLRQLFLILLENAIKYSPPATTIEVGIDVNEGKPLVIIRDHGFGIAPEHLPHIFERFYRASPDPNKESRSGGLGLAIANAIIRAHRGSIECSSKPGKGTAFTIRFSPTTMSPTSERVYDLAQ
jgi:signal transduction histidine kinase